MKKTISLILALAMLISISACSASQPDDPGNFYYRRVEPVYNSTDGVIAPEQRELKGVRDDVGAILDAYFAGPISSELESPFPRDVEVISWNIIRSSLHINLSESFAQLSGIDLTIACACIARTFMELTDVVTVRIRANDAMLDGNKYIIMTEGRVSLADDSLDKLKTDLTLYYTDQQQRYLMGHNISVNLASQNDMIGYLVEQLMTAPEENNLISPIPEGTKLIASEVENGTCTLNFSSEFEDNAFAQSYAQRITLLSLVNTLTQLDNIDRVEFYIEDTPMVRYRQLNIEATMVFDESAIGPVRAGVNEFDATLYLSNGSQLYLTAVPVRIRQLAGLTQAEMVVRNLIAYRNENGFATTIPAQTVLNQVTVENGHCIIDLSAGFLEDTDNIVLSVRSIISSVCALEGINSAQLTIEGETPTEDHGDLFLPMIPNTDWYL